MPLPRPIKLAVIVALVMSMWTGTFAAAESMSLATLDPIEWKSRSHSTAFTDPALEQRFLDAQASALEGMRGFRAAVLAALSIACAVMTMGAIRVLRPLGFPRGSAIRLLGGATLTAAGLRTVDGAQLAAIARRAGHALAPAIDSLLKVQDPQVIEEARRVLPSVLALISAGWTAVIVGLMLILGQYFRSGRVQAQLEVRPTRPPLA